MMYINFMNDHWKYGFSNYERYFGKSLPDQKIAIRIMTSFWKIYKNRYEDFEKKAYVLKQSFPQNTALPIGWLKRLNKEIDQDRSSKIIEKESGNNNRKRVNEERVNVERANVEGREKATELEMKLNQLRKLTEQ